MNTWWQSERKIRRYEKIGDYSIEPWGEKYYALYKGDSLIAVTVYKKGAVEVMKRLSEAKEDDEVEVKRFLESRPNGKEETK